MTSGLFFYYMDVLFTTIKTEESFKLMKIPKCIFEHQYGILYCILITSADSGATTSGGEIGACD